MELSRGQEIIFDLGASGEESAARRDDRQLPVSIAASIDRPCAAMVLGRATDSEPSIGAFFSGKAKLTQHVERRLRFFQAQFSRERKTTFLATSVERGGGYHAEQKRHSAR